MPGRRRLVATAVWRARPPVIVALDDRFGEPLDAYVNGSQVWLRDDGPGGAVLEWRLHPVAGYQRPAGTGVYEVFSATALALATGGTPPAPLERSHWSAMASWSTRPKASGSIVSAAPAAAAKGLGSTSSP